VSVKIGIDKTSMEKILFLLLQLAVLSVKSNAIDKTELKSNNLFASNDFFESQNFLEASDIFKGTDFFESTELLERLTFNNIKGNEREVANDRADICSDDNTRCPGWAQRGECSKNPDYMLKNCKKSCDQCETSCVDGNKSCPNWAQKGECSKNPGYMLVNCKKSCNQCSSGPTTTKRPTTTTRPDSDCTDNNNSCASWASSGECSKNPDYMLVNCKKSCGQCSGGPTQPPGTDICRKLTPITVNYPAYGYGTIFGVFRPVIRSSDPTKYVSTTPNGRGNRQLFSRTLGRFYTVNAYLYNVRFSDQSQTVEFRVDPRLGSGYQAVIKYGKYLGMAPKFARRRVAKFDIAPGNHPQAGGGSYELQALHIELTYAESMERSGSLEEMLMHEGGHASLQNLQSDSGWLRAARADRNYISIYARDNPGREDITESIVPWYALRCRADRLSQNDLRTICSAIPNRIAYLDRLFGTNCNNM